ncbi:HD domain-containing protein [Streptomyces sp. NBC_00536]|uniref:HD domain-containing protein n=1 Tax=Streptomyces sp. NBC_00536 TaxID=2975769 RepID=UPI003FCCB101
MKKPGYEPDQTLWEKARRLAEVLPPYPVVRHLLDAAAMTLFLWDRGLSGNQRRCIAVAFDLGDEPERARTLGVHLPELDYSGSGSSA